MQRVHFQVRVGVSAVKTNIYFVVFDIVVKKKKTKTKKKTNRMRLSVVCTFVDNDTCHYRGHHKARALL